MYRTVAQLDALTERLTGTFPALCTRSELPETSRDGRTVHAIRIRAGEGSERRGVLFVGGTHARELMNPDLLVELAVELLAAYTGGTDIVYGGRRWPAAEIKAMLDAADLHILPCENPDGREYVLNVDDMWRKNRVDNPDTDCEGVDLNRNLDLMWGVTEGQTSCAPCTDIYCGSSAFSEPETRNVKHLLDNEPIDCFVDVHSFSELVLYPWGHAPNQSTDASKRFTSLPTGTCRPIGIDGYEEFIDPVDLKRFQVVGDRVVAAIEAVRGRRYTSEPGVTLYPTTGTHSDYVYSRHIADPSLRKVYGFTFEAGPFVGNARDSFHPRNPEPVKTEVKSGLIGFLQAAVAIDQIT